MPLQSQGGRLECKSRLVTCRRADIEPQAPNTYATSSHLLENFQGSNRCRDSLLSLDPMLIAVKIFFKTCFIFGKNIQRKFDSRVSVKRIIPRKLAHHSGHSSVRQAKLGVSDWVQVPIEKGLTNHSYRVLQSSRR